MKNRIVAREDVRNDGHRMEITRWTRGISFDIPHLLRLFYIVMRGARGLPGHGLAAINRTNMVARGALFQTPGVSLA
ncbi:hypothetical protein TspCOW1_23470 [Thiohalobacter sp. COW1]|nr:hypothetical protein TspCOW1_23470 [Thiohalobacter sp. COW1]